MNPTSTMTIDCEDCGYSYGVRAELAQGRYWPDEGAIERHNLGHMVCQICGNTIHEDHEKDHERLDCTP